MADGNGNSGSFEMPAEDISRDAPGSPGVFTVRNQRQHARSAMSFPAHGKLPTRAHTTAALTSTSTPNSAAPSRASSTPHRPPSQNRFPSTPSASSATATARALPSHTTSSHTPSATPPSSSFHPIGGGPAEPMAYMVKKPCFGS
ncbi:uncharacterized protein BKCO1_300007 [Diplodia corticola]|uniref:Uncharacterized protein n=1 Tax=Diplodia corticola TaxID=236234 RepID=A0A1J9QYG3_9PEZI|nr:uncharacterized protein BKCO1_300007 [Diplodia corticola]OJD33417.1 hypothetical protein BKCO1_300007 [Diplodia corticola]